LENIKTVTATSGSLKVIGNVTIW